MAALPPASTSLNNSTDDSPMPIGSVHRDISGTRLRKLAVKIPGAPASLAVYRFSAVLPAASLQVWVSGFAGWAGLPARPQKTAFCTACRIGETRRCQARETPPEWSG